MNILPNNAIVLVLGEHERAEQQPITVVPALVGSTAEALTGEVLGALPGSRLVVLPVPMGSRDTRRWHFDAWHAIPQAERSRVRLISGPTVAHFRTVIKEPRKVVAVVDEPMTAVAGIIARSREARKTLRALRRDPDVAPWFVDTVASPQSRALLAPWHHTSELPSRPSSTERAAWLEHVEDLPQKMKLVPATAPKRLVRFFSQLLDVSITPPSPPMEEDARAALDDAAPAVEEAGWLDAGLYALANGETISVKPDAG